EIEPGVEDRQRASGTGPREFDLPQALLQTVVRDREVEASRDVVVDLVAIELALDERNRREVGVALRDGRNAREEELQVDRRKHDRSALSRERGGPRSAANLGKRQTIEAGELLTFDGLEDLGLQRDRQRRRRGLGRLRETGKQGNRQDGGGEKSSVFH